MAHEEFTLSQVYLWTMVETRELGYPSIYSLTVTNIWDMVSPPQEKDKSFFLLPQSPKVFSPASDNFKHLWVSPERACGPTCQHHATLCNCSFCPVHSVVSSHWLVVRVLPLYRRRPGRGTGVCRLSVISSHCCLRHLWNLSSYSIPGHRTHTRCMWLALL